MADSTLRQLWARLVSFFRKQDRDREFDEELAAHIELATQDRVRQGLSLPEARRQALIGLGGLEPAKELHRESRGFAWLDGMVQDIRQAVRTLRHSPGFALTAIVTLAISIGANATVFTVTKAALFAGFPLVAGNDRILYLTTNRYCCVSYPDFQDWRAEAKSFQDMAIVHGLPKVLSDPSGFAENYQVTEVSANTFQLVGRAPHIGRDFQPSDETPGAAPVAILSYGFWERRYGRDPAVIGRNIRINGAPTAVIGVMPPGFSFPQKQDLWTPLVPTPDLQKRDARDAWFVFGRLAGGVTIRGARAEMAAIGQRLANAYPLTNRGFLPEVRNFNEFFIGSSETAIYTSLWGAVGFVLLIACANLANLLLARAKGRSREISLRIALGAGRWRIIRQLLIESVILSSLGGAIGWWIARWAIRAYEFAERGPGRTSWRILDYAMDYRVLGYLIAISIGTALLFGLAPALRLSKLDVNSALKDGGRGIAGERGKHLPALLVMAEIALAVVLLAGAGVMIRSFLNIYTADLGFDAANILTMSPGLPAGEYSTGEARISFYSRLTARLEAIPGVESIAIASRLPTGGSAKFPYELAGALPVDESRRPNLSALIVGPGYFRTLAKAVLSGREFNDADGVSGVPAAIVNQQFAARFWPGEDPLGKRLRLFRGKIAEDWLTVVGVVPNIAQNAASRQEPDPLVYLPYRQKPGREMEVMARTGVAPASLVNAFRREMRTVEPDLPVYGPLPLLERLEGNYWSRGLYGVLFLILAAIALLLASIGLYAVIAHSVNQRTQEIGVRMAIGATARDIRGLVLRQGMIPTGIGLIAGLAGSLAVNRVLSAQLVHVSPSDPLTLAVAAAVLVLTAALGCLIPARRAMRVDPVVALRHG